MPRRCSADARPARRPAARATRGYSAVLARVIADVLPYAARTDHRGYLAFIPNFTTWPAALAELTAAAANPYCGAWMESAVPAQVELEVIDWFRTWLGLPAGTAGLLVSGGSAANLTALLVAPEAAGGPSGDAVVYVSDQAHGTALRRPRQLYLRLGWQQAMLLVWVVVSAGLIAVALVLNAGGHGACTPLMGTVCSG